jgi:hypothetical protein
MGAMNAAEQFADDYLTKFFLRPERFSKRQMRARKTLDFRISEATNLVAYCEAKHGQHDD